MTVTILEGDSRTVLGTLPDASVQCCVTSPPYFGLRDYGHDGQIGLEATPEAYVAEMVALFADVRRVLKDDGSLWLNLGDSYASFRDGKATPDTSRGDDVGTLVPKGSATNRMASTFKGTSIKHKDLIGIPWRVAFALQTDGWYLRSDIIWQKPNPMPESVTDRPTKSHEYVFLLTKSERYFYNAPAIAEISANEETRNARTVWSIATQPFKGAHFATMPPELAERCIRAGSRAGDTVLDLFGGAGTTGLVADRLGRNATLIELNPSYAALARQRITDDSPMFAEVI